MRLTNIMRLTTVALVATVATPLTTARAQDAASTPTADARWQAFVGCWAPEPGTPGPTAVCVLPAAGSSVSVVTVAGDKVASRETIDAAVVTTSTRDKCEGEDRARWSPDGKRLFLASERRCDGIAVHESGVMALPSANEWLDVRGVSVAKGPADVRVRRYHRLTSLAGLPADVAAEADAMLADREPLRAAARANAATALAANDVIAASRELDPAVLEAWLVENGDGFELDAKQLGRLADARVPERVIDVMVALSFPDRFAIARGPGGATPRPQVDTTVVRPVDETTRSFYAGDRYRRDYCDDGLLTATSRCYGNGYGGYGSPYGYSPYAYSPYGWGGSSWGYGYGNGAPPVIVVRGSGSDAGGRVVKGRGYTRSGSGESTTETARPRGNTGSSSSSGSSSGSSDRQTTRTREGSSSSGSSSTRSSGGERQSTGRTAKPRNP